HTRSRSRGHVRRLRLRGQHLLHVGHLRLRLGHPLARGRHVLLDILSLLLQVAHALDEAHGQLARYSWLNRRPTAGGAWIRLAQAGDAVSQSAGDTSCAEAIPATCDWSLPTATRALAIVVYCSSDTPAIGSKSGPVGGAPAAPVICAICACAAACCAAA